ncbi:MAG: hypothetical protein A3G41_04855 [Elusimicrobia bacterium RIFCSPLOWO2_12_FULL_59_9]|nr:MAG: hypothetical protein A3G41_04855 [Elusimicrobia bacterium RIFCSPLOWO2_12_FULL_59_9]
MITLKNIHKSFGAQELLNGASLQINAGDRFALVGPNGSGKSTLMKMLLGEEEPDGGEISIKRGVRAGYLPQENAPVSDRSVLEEALSGHENPDDRLAAEAKAVLMGLGFTLKDFGRKASALSGGWGMRVALARLLIDEPDLLLLDEPTNHLDLEALLWFQKYLQEYAGAVFLISHDRAFMNAVCGAIVSVQNHKLKMYYGDYEFYSAEFRAEQERLESVYQRQQEEIAKMEEFIARNRARASTAGRAQSMIKRLERLELVELPPESKKVKIRFPQPQRTGLMAIRLKQAYKSYGEIKVYQGLDFEIERGWKMAFVGHNGAGKSTLLKLLAGVVPLDAGERILGLNVQVGYYSQHRTGQLDPGKTVFQEALASNRGNPEQLVRTVLGTFLFPGDSVFKPVSVLSGGEKSRLAMVKLLLDPPNVLLLDEPTTHLDMESVEALVGALRDFEGTLCCISHDVYFINALANHIVHVDGGRVVLYPGNYDYFERRHKQTQSERDISSPQRAAALNGEPSSENQKERRRQRAAERERLRRLEQLGRQIDADTAQLENLSRDLSNPDIYGDYGRVQAIGREMEKLQEALRLNEGERSRLEGGASGASSDNLK